MKQIKIYADQMRIAFTWIVLYLLEIVSMYVNYLHQYDMFKMNGDLRHNPYLVSLLVFYVLSFMFHRKLTTCGRYGEHIMILVAISATGIASIASGVCLKDAAIAFLFPELVHFVINMFRPNQTLFSSKTQIRTDKLTQ